MKMRNLMLAVLLGAGFQTIAVDGQAQIRKVPDAAKANFNKMYPGAKNVDWKDEVQQFQADFTDGQGRTNRAEFTNKGTWKVTETDITDAGIPAAVKSGYGKSKWADWNIEAAEMLSMPGGAKNYRLKVGKNDLQKKYLTFNSSGRLLKDAITI